MTNSSLANLENLIGASLLSALLLCGCAHGFVAAQDSRAAPTMLQDGDFYKGVIVVEGTYEYFEDGEPCLSVASKDSKKFPYWDGISGVRVCFVNDDEAIDLLGIKDAIRNIDAQNVCGLQGGVTAKISGLWTGLGPATRWYTSELKNVEDVSPYVFLDCSSGPKGAAAP